MVTINTTDASATAVHQRMNQFRALVERYHADPDYRRQVEADPVAAFHEQGMELPSNIAVRVLANTDDTFYMVLPHDPNMDLGDELLNSVAGGGGATMGTAGSLSSAATASCPGTFGTVGTVGSSGSAGLGSP